MQSCLDKYIISVQCLRHVCCIDFIYLYQHIQQITHNYFKIPSQIRARVKNGVRTESESENNGIRDNGSKTIKKAKH